jgi:hypothetical protein
VLADPDVAEHVRTVIDARAFAEAEPLGALPAVDQIVPQRQGPIPFLPDLSLEPVPQIADGGMELRGSAIGLGAVASARPGLGVSPGSAGRRTFPPASPSGKRAVPTASPESRVGPTIAHGGLPIVRVERWAVPGAPSGEVPAASGGRAPPPTPRSLSVRDRGRVCWVGMRSGFWQRSG